MVTVTDQPVAFTIAGKTEEKLTNLFFVLYKNARIIDRNNPTFKRQCNNFHELLKELFAESNEITIKIIAGRYFINHKLARFDDQGLSGAAAIVTEWEAIGMAGVRFRAGVSIDEIEDMFTFVAGIKPKADNLENMSKALQEYQQPSIRFFSAKELENEKPPMVEEVRRQFRSKARSTFFGAMSIVEDNMASVAQGKDIDISKTKRVIRSLIDHIAKDEQSLLELASIKNFDDYTYAH